MLGLQWKKTHPNTGARQFVPVSNDFDSPVVAGAFKRLDVDSAEKFKPTNEGFHPGVFDHKTKSCVIADENKPEDDYYVLTRGSSIQFDWVPQKDGNISTGAIQCGFTSDGDALYVGRFNCGGRLLCGRINQDLGQCEVTVLGEQFVSNEYEVLCLRSVPIGFTYNSLYGLRSSLITPSVCHMISSKLRIQSNDSGSPTFTPPPTPAITRTVTSSQTRSITVKKVIDLTNGSSSPRRKSPSPEPTPVMESTPLRPKKIEFPVTPDIMETPATPAANDSLKSSHKKQRESPSTKWQRYGKGFRLVRSPLRFSPLM
ncbi:uncharacterized protein LOC135220890 [Macrobrachium nipponense]|uniref:uncharacterized protein LOC135220890 n=1 Tax=Macrobrachium nipponense TaxID=159736 RepID=UPI0030C7FBFE